MYILVIGSGGREHALAWKLAQSDRVQKVFLAPGNAGTALEPKLKNIAIAATDIDALLQFAQSNDIGLTIVGPEQPLVDGLADRFQQAGCPCFGPSQAAAQLEGSKSFSKDFLQRNHIPTANYATFTDVHAAKNYVRLQGAPIVIKADGLAAGKGVIVAQTPEQAYDAIEDMLSANRFGEAGSRVVIEEFLQGEEASFIVMVDGENVLPFATSQDHKARDNGDKGPNTGGMGAYSPAPVVTAEIHQRIMNEIIIPTVQGMKAEGSPYLGFLYAGLMIDTNGAPKVIEFNCRCGDPETQPIMMRLQSDLADLCLAAIDGKLNEHQIEFDPRAALAVVLAAGGYPGHYTKDKVITDLAHFQNPESSAENTRLFHAGTRFNNQGQIVTAGGRVLCVTALGRDVTEAQQRAYERVHQIDWKGIYFRTDIGYRAIKREYT